MSRTRSTRRQQAWGVGRSTRWEQLEAREMLSVRVVPLTEFSILPGPRNVVSSGPLVWDSSISSVLKVIPPALNVAASYATQVSLDVSVTSKEGVSVGFGGVVADQHGGRSNVDASVRLDPRDTSVKHLTLTAPPAPNKILGPGWGLGSLSLTIDHDCTFDSFGVCLSKGSGQVTVSNVTATVQVEEKPDYYERGLELRSPDVVRFEYGVTGSPPGATYVDLYWSADTKFDPDPAVDLRADRVVSVPNRGSVKSVDFFSTTQGTTSFEAPAGRPYLLAVIDPPSVILPKGSLDEEFEDNNVASLLVGPAPRDVAITDFDWNEERDPAKPETYGKRGVDVKYEVRGVALGGPSTIEFYWVDQNRQPIGGPLSPQPGGNVLEAGLGAHGPLNEPGRWGPVPPGAAYLMAFADPANMAGESESTRENNKAFLRLHTLEEVLSGSVEYYGNDSPQITAAFLPGKLIGQRLTMSEAEIVAGVDHFSWRQNIIHLPSNADVLTLVDWPTNLSISVLTKKVDSNLSYRPFLKDYSLGPELTVGTVSLGRPIVDLVVQPEGFGYTNRYTTAFVYETTGGQKVFTPAVLDGRSGYPAGSDSRPYYYNESPPKGAAEQSGSIGKHTFSTSLGFLDRPRVPLSPEALPLIRSDDPGGYRGFATWLVGVGYGGSPDQDWAGRGYKTGFKWKSNLVALRDGGERGSVFGAELIDNAGALPFERPTLGPTPTPSPTPTPGRTPTRTPALASAQAREAFVSSIYRDVMGREPDTAGGAAWASRLAGGIRPARVLAELWRSSERRRMMRDQLAPRVGFASVLVRALRAAQAMRPMVGSNSPGA